MKTYKLNRRKTYYTNGMLDNTGRYFKPLSYKTQRTLGLLYKFVYFKHFKWLA